MLHNGNIFSIFIQFRNDIKQNLNRILSNDTDLLTRDALTLSEVENERITNYEYLYAIHQKRHCSLHGDYMNAN